MKEYPVETYLPLDVQMWLCQYVSPESHTIAFATIAGFIGIIGLTALTCVFRSPDAAEE